MTAKCPCSGCGTNLEFDIENEGESIICPVCSQPTRLYQDVQAMTKIPSLNRQSGRLRTSGEWFKWGFVVVAFIIIGGIASYYYGFKETSLLMVKVSLSLCLYFLPAFVARHKRNAKAILVLNLFLGWTLIGWVIALVWAYVKDPNEK